VTGDSSKSLWERNSSTLIILQEGMTTRDPIAAQIDLLKRKQQLSKMEAESFARESPLARAKEDIKRQLMMADDYRVSVLKGVNTFGKRMHSLILLH
jgi:hypothetical protein